MRLGQETVYVSPQHQARIRSALMERPGSMPFTIYRPATGQRETFMVAPEIKTRIMSPGTLRHFRQPNPAANAEQLILSRTLAQRTRSYASRSFPSLLPPPTPRIPTRAPVGYRPGRVTSRAVAQRITYTTRRQMAGGLTLGVVMMPRLGPDAMTKTNLALVKREITPARGMTVTQEIPSVTEVIRSVPGEFKRQAAFEVQQAAASMYDPTLYDEQLRQRMIARRTAAEYAPYAYGTVPRGETPGVDPAAYEQETLGVLTYDHSGALGYWDYDAGLGKNIFKRIGEKIRKVAGKVAQTTIDIILPHRLITKTTTGKKLTASVSKALSSAGKAVKSAVTTTANAFAPVAVTDAATFLPGGDFLPASPGGGGGGGGSLYPEGDQTAQTVQDAKNAQMLGWVVLGGATLLFLLRRR